MRTILTVTHTDIQTDTETDKAMAIVKILQICLKITDLRFYQK